MNCCTLTVKLTSKPMYEQSLASVESSYHTNDKFHVRDEFDLYLAFYKRGETRELPAENIQGALIQSKSIG